MPSTAPVQDLVEAIHYLTPFAVFLYYLVATTVGVCTLQTSNTDGRKDPRKAVLWTMVAVIITYLIEDGMILSQLSLPNSPFATTDTNIYILASILVWLIFTATLLGAENPVWFPLHGSWIITAVSEVLTLGLRLSQHWPYAGLEQAQTTVQALRILLLLSLPVLTFALPRIKAKAPQKDEEAAPLLGHSQETSEESQTSTGTSKYGSTGTDSTVTVVTSTGQTEEVVDEYAKKEQENREQMEKRLKEIGNWWTYAKRFTIFLPYIWPRKKSRLQLRMVGVGLCIVSIRVLNFLTPCQLGLLVNSLGHTGTTRPFIELSIYILLAALESHIGIRALRTYLWLPVENNAYQSIDCTSYNHIMSLSSDFHDAKQSGELYTSMQQGRSVVELLETLLYRIVPMVMDLVIACIFVYYLFDAYMVLIVTSTMVLYLWASIYFTMLNASAQREQLVSVRRAYQVLFDTMGGWRTVSYFNRLQHAQDNYSSATALSIEARRRSQLLYCLTDGMQSMVLDVGLFGACFYAVYQVIYKEHNVGQFVTLFTYWANLAGPLNTLSNVQRDLIGNLVDAEQLLELYQTKPSVKDGFKNLHLSSGRVDFERVKFSYDGKKQIINDVSFHVEPGQTIALIGETGGGKSTILKLLFRFYDVTEGQIAVDGQDIRTVTLESLREQIGVVPQDPSLFNDTIFNNIRYAKLDATEAEVVEACKAAAIHDKILTYTDGYNSKVGEHGVKLSGGELQRVAIARAILKDAKIILLDEATSSVDSETESKIQDALKILSKGRTTFVVAHRLSTIADADRIIVIKDGAILEQGPPAELLRSKGKYYRLWTKQMGIQEIPDSPEGGSEEVDQDVDNEIKRCQQKEQAKESPKFNQESGQSHKSQSDPGKKAKRPDPKKAASSAQMAVFGANVKRVFRADAPEFIPQYQRGTVASGGDESHDHGDSAAHSHAHEASSGKPTEKDKRQRSRKRKARQDNSAAPSAGLSNLDRPSEAHPPLDVPGKRDPEPTAKRSRFARRHQSKSEPGAQGLVQSQGDGTSDFDNEPSGSGEGRPMLHQSRRVTAPSDPPTSGPSSSRGGPQGQRRYRQRHWRARNRDGSAAAPSVVSAGASQDWSSDSPSAGPPTVPFASPAGGVTPVNEVEGGGPRSGMRFEGGGVRFVPGC